MLSDRTVRTAPEGVHPDRENLYLRVRPASRTFLYRDRRGGRDSWITLGHYPTMSLAQARTSAAAYKRGTGGHMTFTAAWGAFYKHLETQYREPEQVKARIERDILPDLGPRQLRVITRREVSEVLQGIVDRGAPVQANKTLADVKKVFRFAVEKGWLEGSPAEILTRRAVGGRETPRSRTLSWKEITEFLVFLRDTTHKTEPGTRWTLYMILLTGCRSSEALSTLRGQSLTLGNTKAGRPHQVPSTPHVRAALRMAQGLALPDDQRALSYVLRRADLDFTPHDLRRTFASRMADIGVAPHVIEKLLNHKMEGVMAVYNHATYWPERVAAQRLWGCKLAALRRGAKP